MESSIERCVFRKLSEQKEKVIIPNNYLTNKELYIARS